MLSAHRLPVLSCAESAALETAYLKQNPGSDWNLMKRAAEELAFESLIFLNRTPKKILVLVGSGNNGADALLAAVLVSTDKTQITAVFATESPSTPLAKKVWQLTRQRVKKVSPQKFKTLVKTDFCLIFDGLLGQGFRAPLRPEMKKIILASASLKGLRVAVDLPSGVGDDSKGPAFKADLTISIGCLKRPLLEPKNNRYVGRIRVIDIGLPLGVGTDSCSTLSALDPIKKPRSSNTEKRQQGRILIVGGSQSMPGAVIMNTAAALQAGGGLVTTCLPQSIRARAAVAYPEAMWNGLSTNTSGVMLPPKNLSKLFKQKDVLLIGSGMSEKSSPSIKKFIKNFGGDVILDADALRPEVVKSIPVGRNYILLPHGGEFLRLSGKKMSAETGRAFARKTKTIVVLKGPMTMITDGTHLIYIPFGGPILARGGSGDCLAGMIAAVVARRRTLKLSLLGAVECGVVWHARAADLLRQDEGEEAVRTTQILSELSKALK